ncbi:MAG: lysophospholipid acyltransferase family protein [Bacteroidota bacterium]
MMNRIVYILFRCMVALFSFVPFRVLYFFSDLIHFLLFHIAGYRKKVVFDNLRRSFPEKSEKERYNIAKGFYHHLADLLMESMKSFSMTELEVTKRFKVAPSSFLEEVYKEGRSIIVVAAHLNNWEWTGIGCGSQMVHKPVGFYKPMSNQLIDAYMQKKRIQGRSALVSINDTVAVFKTDWGEPAAFGMIADQSPSTARLAYWVDFLNQPTATLHGPEKYARVYNMPVVYFYIMKVKRGYYEGEYRILSENPATTKTGEITAKYMKMLEENILEQPENYLWSHRRWKLKQA